MELKEYQAQYRELIEQAEAIREINADKDEWPAEDAEVFDKIMEDADTLKATVDRLLKAKEHEEWANKIVPSIVHPDGSDDEPTDDKAKSAAHIKAFDRFLRTGVKVPSDVVTFKAAMQEAATEGLELVPEEWVRELVQAISAAGVMYPLARKIQLGALTAHVPTLTASTKAVLTAEEDAFSEVEPTTDDVDFVAYKFTRLAKVSDELLADAMFDVWGQILNPDFANAFALAIDYYGTIGSGSGQPEGVVTGATVGKTAASASAIAVGEIFDLYHALGYQYRGRATWMCHDSTIKAIRQLKDTTNQYLWQPGLQAGQPDRLMGRPVVTNNNMAEIAASAKTLLFGDFSFFWLGMREGVTVKRLEELYAANGQVGFRAYNRWDSHVMLAAAIQVLQQASA